MNVLFDTNFLIECAKKKIDFFLECERILDRPRIVILKQVTKELELISKDKKNNQEDRQAAGIILQIISNLSGKNMISIEESEIMQADSALLDYDGDESIIATFDKGLKSRIKNSMGMKIKNKSLALIR